MNHEDESEHHKHYALVTLVDLESLAEVFWHFISGFNGLNQSHQFWNLYNLVYFPKARESGKTVKIPKFEDHLERYDRDGISDEPRLEVVSSDYLFF